MRLSSWKSTRIHSARRGTSRSSAFSIAMQNAVSPLKNER